MASHPPLASRRIIRTKRRRSQHVDWVSFIFFNNTTLVFSEITCLFLQKTAVFGRSIVPPIWGQGKLLLLGQPVHQLSAPAMPHSSRSPRQVRLQEILVTERAAAGLTQRDLARLLERPHSFVSKYEVGERRLDAVELLESLRGYRL